VLVLVIVLIVTNLATLGALAWFELRPVVQPRPDDALARSLNAALRPPVSTSGSRRLITIEILNPIELAGSRGRLAGIAGSLAPGITRRIVHEQAMKLVKRQLAAEKVVADVRLHAVPPQQRPPVPPSSPRNRPAQGAATDELRGNDASTDGLRTIEPVDLVKRDDAS
jgi:hypothetical protein